MKQHSQQKHIPQMPAHGKTPRFPSVPAQKVSVKVPVGGAVPGAGGAITSNRTTGGY